MRFIDLFSGIGGFRRGMELAGHRCVGFCEFDKYAVMSYAMMHLATEDQREYIKSIPAPLNKKGEPNFKRRQQEILKEEYRNGEWYADDIRTVDATNIPKADCWCFGAPCQDFSIAGNRKGLDGDRSSLVKEVFRILGGMREKDRPEWLIYENVKGMLSSNKGFDFLTILLAMDELGYDVEWQILNSKDWGVPQNRERVYTVGYLRSRGFKKILPIKGADGENSIQQLGNYLVTKTRTNPNQGRIYSVNGIAPCLNKMDGGGRQPSVVLPCFVDMNYEAGITQTENARCLQSRYYKGICNRTAEISGVLTPISEDILLPGTNYNQRKVVHPIGGIARTLISSGHSGNEPKVAIPVVTDKSNKRQNDRKLKENGILIQLADNLTVYAVWYERYQCYIAIRRLTPKECFRLQGWEDVYFERAAMINSDSQLYKQAGNGVTVSVAYEIAERIDIA